MNEFLLLLLLFWVLTQTLVLDKTASLSCPEGQEGPQLCCKPLPPGLMQAVGCPRAGPLEGRLLSWVSPGVPFIGLSFQVLITNFPISHELFQDLQEPTLKSKGSSLCKCHLQNIFSF